MAIVKDQSIPTDQFEDTLDPPIDFKDQYRRALSEGIDHPKLPAGKEIVTFSKMESRPAQRSDSPHYNKPIQQAWRDEFSLCLECWKSQYATEEEIETCHSAGSKHYVEPWQYVPGAKPTYFTQFMSACLNWTKTNPGIPFPKCEDLIITPETFEFCPGDFQAFEIPNGNGPHLSDWPCGTYVDAWTWESDPNSENCPDIVTLKFVDLDGRKGCAIGNKKTEAECCTCEGAELEISYTTLIMSFNEQQTLSIIPEKQGCPPYFWNLEGPGSLIPSEDNLTALFIAPEGNPSCEDSIIQLTDACDLVAEIQIRVTCTGVKYVYNWVYQYSSSCLGNPSQHYYVYGKAYDCFTGDLLGEWFETQFTVFGPIPTSPTQVFCCEEGEGSPCTADCGLTMTTPYCHNCEDIYCGGGEGCCPP